MLGFPRNIELLAPARDATTAIEAINCGADAVYMGATRFGARYAASNSIEEIAQVVNHAHKFNAKVYITVNTIIKDSEISDVRNLICKLYDVGVDALIVQDMGILELDIPPIELHASTQCDISSVAKAQFLESVGFSQLVLARELSLDEIKSISSSVKIPIEVFVHGALCVSFSGKCHASQVLKGRSANRGECAQICRFSYNLIDGNNQIIKRNKHFLSLKDLNQIDKLNDLLTAGASSFKIEGRLKDTTYVKNVVSAYRRALDSIIEMNPDKYKRSSNGKSLINFEPDLKKSFNRGFTHYFLETPISQSLKIASINTAKSLGEPIGFINFVKGNKVDVKVSVPLHNGDGISFFNKESIFEGMRVNNVLSNSILQTLEPAKIAPKTPIYRTFDKQFNDLALRPSKRTININFTLTESSLIAQDELGNSAEFDFNQIFEKSKSDQHDKQKSALSKLGDTHYIADSIIINTDKFIPASLLSEARRYCVISLMDKQQKHAFDRTRNRRCTDSGNNDYYKDKNLNYTDNVSNKFARNFYLKHGANHIDDAIECEVPYNTHDDELLVMTTRYCLRREFGACKMTNNASSLKEPLKLVANDGTTLRLNFDCKNCRMQVYTKSNKHA